MRAIIDRLPAIERDSEVHFVCATVNCARMIVSAPLPLSLTSMCFWVNLCSAVIFSAQ